MTNTESFADLHRDQEEVAGLIQRFWSNICKLGKDKMTWALLEQRKTLLDRYWDTFFDGHRMIIRCKEAASSPYVQQDVFSKTEEAYLHAATMIAQTLEERPASSPRGRGHASSSAPLEPQLPKIELPTFSGDPLQWESFRDLFKSLVHDVPHLPEVKKVLYLKSCLTGEAAKVVQNTPITDAGYRGAWEDLEFRYGNARLLSFAHHRALLDCPPAQRPSSTELKRLLDTFRQTIRAYAALKKPVAAWDEWFVYLLSQKLDNSTNLAWETSLANSREVPTFNQLTLFMENRIQALDTASRREPALRSTAPRDNNKFKPKDSTASKRSTTVLTTAAKPKEARKCPSCAGSHNLGYCFRFKALPPAQRKEQACSLRVCLNCLSKGHETRKCTSKQVCLACSRQHHTLLHDGFSGESAASATSVGSSQALPTTATTSYDDVQHAATTLSISAHPRTTALLATARVKLEAPSGQVIEARALLDTGSDSSLVTEWVAQALRLPRREVRVTISGVQEQEAGVATGEVDLTVRPRHASTFRLPIRALVLRKLTSLLPAQQVSMTSWPHLQGITLADPDFGMPARIDVILGADVCGALFQEATRTGPAGTPTAKQTPLGWVLMGPASAVDSASKGVVRSYHCHAQEDTHQLLHQLFLGVGGTH